VKSNCSSPGPESSPTPACVEKLAEDLTARAAGQCVPLLDRPGIPEHIRALTSRHVLDVEADLAGRSAVRGTHPDPHDLGDLNPTGRRRAD
jgi:exodeoxyribonuclease V alpha subunit